MNPFVVEGKLELLMQEGGFAWDGWKLGERRLDELVCAYFNSRCDEVGNNPIGYVRITIERLENCELGT